MGIIKRFFLRRALKQGLKRSDTESVADEVLKDALKELQITGRTADKILKAKLIRQESRHALNKIKELDEEEEEEEEEEPREDMQDKIVSALLNKFMGGNAPTETTNKLQEIAQGLTPEQIDALKTKFLK